MKRIVLAALLLTGCWSQQNAGFHNGDNVAAKWHTSWYQANVIGKDGDGYMVRYTDSTTGNVKPGELRYMLDPRQVHAGQPVLAVWRTSAMYPGVVKSVSDKGAIIIWDDGSSPSFVPFGQIASR